MPFLSSDFGKYDYLSGPSSRTRNSPVAGRTVDKREIETVYYTVTGSGQFPFDMLRRDRAWPANESQSYKLVAGDDVSEVRVVVLCGLSYPTVDRWRSFGWRVNEG